MIKYEDSSQKSIDYTDETNNYLLKLTSTTFTKYIKRPIRDDKVRPYELTMLLAPQER